LIPKNIRETLENQELSVLYEIKELVENQISRKETFSDRKRPDGREILEVKNEGSVTYRLERVSCGKNCKGCPHGPYWYAYWREGGKTRSKYVGKYLVKKT
jgi:hypothetical protein